MNSILLLIFKFLEDLQRRTAVLEDFIDNIDAVKIKDICSEIMRNKSIYIYGRNMSSLPAKYLYSMLNSMDIHLY